MLIEISKDRFVNPLSNNIIGIFHRKEYDKYSDNKYSDESHSYILEIGCTDGIGIYTITKEDRDLILNAIRDERILKDEVRKETCGR